MTANEVIGKMLIAEQDVPLYAYASTAAPVVGIVPKGNSFGPIYSWVEKNGKLWWMFDYTIPGNLPGAYYCIHDPKKLKLGADPTGPNLSPPSNFNLPTITSAVPEWIWYVGGGLLLLNLLRK